MKAFRAHHDFQKESPRNDVALLLLSERLKFNSKVQSIELAAKTPKKGELAFASGFGNNIVVLTQGRIKGDFGGPLAVNGSLVGLSLSPLGEFTNTVYLSKWIKATRKQLEHLK